ncbi:MAG: hypothetical protein QOD77_1636 [Thermoplasmata archaeon]|jgi:hypothetical protein|nr:hypothetical protein [Thermoplasmata archaeon]
MRRRLWITLASVLGLALLILAPGLLLQIAASAFLGWAAQRLFRRSFLFREVLRFPSAWVAALAPAAAFAALMATSIGWFALGALGGFVAAWRLGMAWRSGDLVVSAMVLGIVACGAVLLAVQLVYVPPHPSLLFGSLQEGLFRMGVTAVSVVATIPVSLAYGGLAAWGRRRARLRAAVAVAAGPTPPAP